jgi:hypothetical protein
MEATSTAAATAASHTPLVRPLTDSDPDELALEELDATLASLIDAGMIESEAEDRRFRVTGRGYCALAGVRS